MSDEESRKVDDLLAQFVEIISPGSVMTKYVVVVEAIDATDSERVLITSTPDDASAWDTMGLLSYGMAKENAKITQNTRADE